MAQHRLDISYVRSSLEHQRRHRVPEDMASASLTYFRSLDVMAGKPTEVVRCEWGPHRGKKHDAFIWLHHQIGPQLPQILFEPSQCSIPNRNDTVPLPFAFSDGHQAMFLVNIVEPQMEKLHSENSRRVEKLK